MVENAPLCDQVLSDDQAVRYVQQTLPEADREAFEIHVLECASCSDLLEAARLARDVLTEDALPARPAPLRLVRVASLAAGLATVAAASFLLLRPPASRPAPQAPPDPTVSTSHAPPATRARTAPAPELAELSRVDAPVYVPLTLRSASSSTSAAFDRAMGHYARREYEPAAEGLRAVVKERPSYGEAWFFLGVSELLSGHPHEARATLARAAVLGQPPYAAAAVFFNAKAELRLGEIDPARRSLSDTVAAGGPYAAEARRLIERLDRLEPSPRP